MNNITWSFMSKTPVTNEEIQVVEQYLNIKLPNDFVACVKKYDGGYPNPKVFDVPGQDENVFSDLLTLHIEDKYSIVQNYNSVKDRLVAKVYPFARDPFGNLLCFDYRNSTESPTVVFWDHEEENIEEAIYPVCSTFTELLASLRDFEEED
ncbi:SMI1/KNR4 family protein [Bacillus thuringiensis LM1212]|uniref:SMI1/KNR4 family protein n=1 Tax=Bacillus cereus group TaxID=86661 RepID=UPI00042729FC|nr:MULTISPECIES: SMI1/KNR4 family protein [Bacillus cereus group]AXY08935.1 SMI1/KNR4 family protein [Bacillus thuringiensis LM1212]MBG9840950.1 SMI1/KNR4 family protein [Bacillus tropicus]MBG9879960.1 SMI1/KNR4 family protein [Bacillus tropicus]MBG9922312.1 SMI1/KNR4 family protein [Bacillus tropicus]MBJ8351490.1 1,3-beta-glucan synthase regulator [Bacillus mycoides]